MDQETTEIKVSTWIAVIAEMARSRGRSRLLAVTPDGALKFFEEQLESAITRRLDPPIGEPEIREGLLAIAALTMRMLDEHFPGDGLEF